MLCFVFMSEAELENVFESAIIRLQWKKEEGVYSEKLL